VPAYVVLELASPRQRAVGGQTSPLERATVQRMLARHGGTLLAASPPPDDAADRTVFATIAVADFTEAQALAEALRTIDGIASAYAKPGDELP
jgi:uncharacterized protein YbjT (DUF2867 family)